jgi:predicted MPP superfamily phosphohydrolase
MLPEERLRVALFCLTVAAVYVAAAATLVSWRKKRSLKARGKAVLAAAGAGVLCMLWGFLVEPYWLERTSVEVHSRKLERRCRIAQLSDLHCDATARLEPELPAAISAERPDAIVFTGDAANSREGIPVLRKLLSELARIAPFYAVRGNWDVGGGGESWSDPAEIEARRTMFEGTGVRELDGDAVRVRPDLWIAGVSDAHHDRVEPALALVPPAAFSVFLCHRPDLIEAAARGHADLYLAGHTHGGQVALPFYGALVTFSHYGKRFEHGLYQVGETLLYVNRGIGMDGAGAPRVRFCARPELTIIDLGP